MKPMQDGEVEVKNDMSEGVEGEAQPRVYELGYLLLPSIPEENIPTMYGNLKDLVNSFGGEAISDEIPRMISLAYTMSKVTANVRSKFNTAYFGWLKFSMNPEKVLELKKKLDLNTDVIRFLLLKTVKENTIAARRFVGRDAVRRPTSTTQKDGVGEEVVVPINKEEVDKEIDAMVAAV